VANLYELEEMRCDVVSEPAGGVILEETASFLAQRHGVKKADLAAEFLQARM